MFKTRRRLGTTFALVIGLAAIPTVALAVTTDALPGDPLKPGQENTIVDATTTLTGKVNSTQLTTRDAWCGFAGRTASARC